MPNLKRRKISSKLYTSMNKKKKNKLKLAEGDFPGGTVVKNLPASAGDTGSSPALGRSHMLRSN